MTEFAVVILLILFDADKLLDGFIKHDVVVVKVLCGVSGQILHVAHVLPLIAAFDVVPLHRQHCDAGEGENNGRFQETDI